MVTMENAEEVMQILDRFTRLKQKEIPKELDEYLGYVAKTGDTIFNWTSLKYLFREKLLNVIKTFHDTTPRVDEIPQYPNVDPFNYESMKSSLLERLELFNAAPFTIQRLCELLIDPRKQYSRIDKFMRALEKNILVVSTVEPGRKRTESENGDSLDSVVNGDISLDVNVDIDMEADGLFHNSENTNGNGIASKAEVEAANDEVKLEEKAAAKTTHANDDDNLPNPKKAKLDLPEEEDEQQVIAKENEESVENLTVEKEQIVKESKAAKDEEVQKEKAEKMVCEEKRENKEDIEIKAEANVEKEKDVLKVEIKVEDEKMHEEMEEKKESDDKETFSIAASGDDKGESKEEKKVAESKETEQVLELEKDGYLNKKEDKSAKIEEKREVSGKVKSDNKSDDKEGIHQEKAQVENSSEIVVEKQELEIGEKVEIVEKKCIETKINIENRDKSENETLRKSDKETKEEVADKGEDKQVKKQDIPQEKLEDTKEVNTESKLKEVKQEKEAEGNEIIESTKPKKQSESEVEPTKTEEQTLKEHTNVEHEIKEATKTETETDQQKIEEKVSKDEEESAIPTPSKIDIKETEKEIIAPITQDEKNSSKKELSLGEEKQADAKKESVITSASIETSPILTLNDQTMAEDTSIGESTPTIEEIVMAEPSSNNAANSAKDFENPTIATAMSTDEAASTNSKIEEEPSGMEVDDTSQEAMDQ